MLKIKEENWPGCTELPYFIGFDESTSQNIKTVKIYFYLFFL